MLLVLAPLMMGWHVSLPLEAFWTLCLLAVAALCGAVWYGARRFRWPLRAEALARVDAALPGRPISALMDHQAIGAGDAASQAVWRAHLDRMQERSRSARAVEPDLRLASRDPYGLRFMALILFAAALLFGSVLQVGTVTQMAPGRGGDAMASGPVWEGWIEPPAYTGKPTLYLNDIPPGPLEVAEGSEVTLRLYGEVGALTVSETVSNRTSGIEPASAAEQSFTVADEGRIAIEGPGGATWEVSVLDDAAPQVSVAGEPEVDAEGQMSLPFSASDDYGVTGGTATVELDLDAVDRTYGLATAPDPREPLVLDLPMPFTGDRAEFEEALIANLSQHPWARLPVTLTLEVTDAHEQTGTSESVEMRLPGRRFFEPKAQAVIEQRRDLLWSKDNAPRVRDVLRAVAYRPEGFFPSRQTYLRLSFTLRRLASMVEHGMSDEEQAEIAEALWELAVQLEDGTLADARQRLERAQERLAEAMENGASQDEIQELMQELREAVDDYTRMLAERGMQDPQGDGTDQPDTAQNGESFEFSQNELQALMDRIQELMEEGRMAEAQQLMEQLNQLMENMRVTQGQPGDGGPQSQGEQSMQDLSETLRDQQGLSDETFRDLQEQFGQQGQQGQGDQPGEGDLAQRQEQLRRELERQQGNLPNLGGEAADEARRQLDRAGEAMEGAEEALREGDRAEALDRQAEAMDALREGIRGMGEAMAQNRQQQGQQPGQGQQQGEAGPGRVDPAERDPLGRQLGREGELGTNENMMREDTRRRAQDLLEELRRRSSEQDRSEEELDYLRRLLERF